MTVTCHWCGRTVSEDDAYPFPASGIPVWVCSPRCGAAARRAEREVR